MTGSKSDLRIGLSKQMVEIHEPIRLLTLVEAHESHIIKLMEKNKKIKNLVMNRWIQLGRICPNTKEIFYLDEFLGWRTIL